VEQDLQVTRNILQEALVKIQVLELSLPMVEEQVPDIPTVQQVQDRLRKFPHMSTTDSVAAVEVVAVEQKASGQVREKAYRVLD
jgi:hypothetical protein